MAYRAPKIRLYVQEPLGDSAQIVLGRDQSHYLTGVMRQLPGQHVAVFNGQDGEWDAEITGAGRRSATLCCHTQIRPQDRPADLWLCFAPIKKARTDFIVEKATEMGVRHIQPVLTEYTNAERLRIDRLQAHCVEAAEQCGGVFVPKIADPVKLPALIAEWDTTRNLWFCDEESDQMDLASSGSNLPKAAVLIGPEGGFSPAERALLLTQSFTDRIHLGPRILRADTAAVAALTLWQAQCGDWAI